MEFDQAEWDRAFGRNVQGARKAAGLSQQEFADRLRTLGLDAWSQNTVSRLERGDRQARLAEAGAMAQILGCDLSELLEAGEGLPVATQLRTELIAYQTTVTTAGQEMARVRRRMRSAIRSAKAGGIEPDQDFADVALYDEGLHTATAPQLLAIAQAVLAEEPGNLINDAVGEADDGRVD